MAILEANNVVSIIIKDKNMYYTVTNCVRRTVYRTVHVVLYAELGASYSVLNCVRRTVY